jgi:hypothetical protein
LTNLSSESETCVGSRVHLVGVSISFEKNFYRLPFTPPSLVRRIGPSCFERRFREANHPEELCSEEKVRLMRRWNPDKGLKLVGDAADEDSGAKYFLSMLK